MKNLLLSIILISALYSCNTSALEGYEISGVVQDLPDSTVVLLILNDSIINKAVIFDNSFAMHGRLDESSYVELRIENSRNRKGFYIENKNVQFITDGRELGNAKIYGSLAQIEHEELEKKIEPLRTAMNNNRSLRREGKLNKDSLMDIQFGLLDKRYEIEKDFCRQYPNSPVSIRILNIYKAQWGIEEVKSIFNQMSNKAVSSVNGKLIQNFINLNRSPEVGDLFVDFSMTDTNRITKEFSNLQDKYTLLEFWASNCAPCRISNPALKKVYEHYKPKGFEIVGISLDSNRDQWKNAIKDDGLSWHHLSDLRGVNNMAALIYGVDGIPDNLLIGPDGLIFGRRLEVQELGNVLEEIMK